MNKIPKIVFLSQEQADIDYYNQNIASPFDEDWEGKRLMNK
ncbi:hypothetical protein AAAA28_21875 [Providencia stuartii]